MQNTERGIHKITLDRERTLKFTLNTLIDVEDELGISLASIGDKMSIKMVRTLLTAGLKHEDPSLTEEFVGEQITMENIQEVQEALSLAMGAGKN